MFQGFSGATVDFMWGIRFNNEKGWFEAHKETVMNVYLCCFKDAEYEAFRRVLQ